MKSNQEYVQEWLNELRFATKLASKTVQMYGIRIKQFVDSLETNKSLIDVKRPDIIKYLSNESDSINTKEHKQSIICNFYNWMCDNDYISKHPMMNRLHFANEERNPKFIEKNQWEIIERFLRRDLSTFAKERNFVMMYLMIHSGLRSFEILNLKVNNINFNQQEINIIGKRNKERIVQINTFVTKVLNNYINKYKLVDYVFPNEKMGKLSKSSMDQLFTMVSKKTGIEINPHMTRHTYGQWEYDRGVPLEIIQKQMGHSSGETTKIYAKVRSKQVKEAINQ